MILSGITSELFFLRANAIPVLTCETQSGNLGHKTPKLPKAFIRLFWRYTWVAISKIY